MKKVLTVLGTRPEAIKLAPVVNALRRSSERIVSRVCVTGQHREMLDQVLRLFNLDVHYDLDVMSERQSPTSVASTILKQLEGILKLEAPDLVLVQGDTTTVMAASIAAFYNGTRVGHVEAGLRTYNKWHPFPEEINRRIAGAVADLHFAPTENARQNLLQENVPPASIFVTGNTVIDALQWVSSRQATADLDTLFAELGVRAARSDDGVAPSRIILVTAHRRENHGRPIEQICLALKDLADFYGERVQIVYPVHLNPNVQEPVRRILGNVANVVLTEPLDYEALVYILERAHLVLTDSGGLQEEAPGLGKPVLVLRETTERPEGLEAGTVKLVGTDRAKIVRVTRLLLDDETAYRRMATAVNPYGDGKASERIVEVILSKEREPEAGRFQLR